MNSYKELTRESYITAKDLKPLKQEQLKFLSIYVKGRAKVLDDDVQKILDSCQEWGVPERKECQEYITASSEYPINRVGRYEEASFGKVFSMEHYDGGTKVSTGTTVLDFNDDKFPQQSSLKTRGSYQVLVNFYCHMFKIEEGEVQVVVKGLGDLLPKEFSPFRPSVLERMTATWKEVLNTVCTIVKKKTYDTATYEQMVVQTLNECDYADYWVLSHQIFDYIQPVQKQYIIGNKTNLIYNCVFNQHWATYNGTDKTGTAASAARQFHEKIGSWPRYFKIAPVVKVRFPAKETVDLKTLITCMTDVVARLGGNDSSIIQSVECTNFPGRMSNRSRQMATICSVIEAWYYSTSQTADREKILYVYGVNVGMFPIIYTTLQRLSITRVKIQVEAKLHGGLEKLKSLILQKEDIVSQGHTMYFGGPLSTPQKNTNIDLHYEAITKSQRDYTIYIGQCTSQRFWETEIISDTEKTPRYVYHWYDNISAVAVASKVKLVSRWNPFIQEEPLSQNTSGAATTTTTTVPKDSHVQIIKGRQDLYEYKTFKDYMGEVLLRIKRSYETIFAAMPPVNYGWATLLTAEAKGIQISYTDEMEYTLSRLKGFEDEENVFEEARDQEDDDDVPDDDDSHDDANDKDYGTVIQVVESKPKPDLKVLQQAKKSKPKEMDVREIRDLRMSAFQDFKMKFTVPGIELIAHGDLPAFNKYVINLLTAGELDSCQTAVTTWMASSPTEKTALTSQIADTFDD